MKQKVTMREIRKTYPEIIKLGYCEAAFMLCRKEPKYYNAGIYGWNADIYEISPQTVIVTGYRPFGNMDAPDYLRMREYEKRAEAALLKTHDWESQKSALDALIAEFVDECRAMRK